MAIYSEGVLQVRLLGRVAAERDGEQLPLSPPTGRLLAVLALRPGPQDRDAVAALLWPGTAGSAARANLRTAVWALRKVVGDGALIASRATVGLRPESVTVDLDECWRRAAAGDAAAAATLCHSELLAGYAEDWAERARRQQQTGLAETLAARSATADRDGDAAAAARWSRLRCELDPLNEAAHADLVRQLAAAGDRAGALVAGREVTARLRAELGIQPGPLLRAALAETRGPAAAPFPGGPVPARPLYGRAAELRTLTAAWTAARAGHGRVVLITGEAGIGKTRLVAELARRADNAGARTAVGAGVDVGGEAPLAIWQELAPQLARSVPPPPEHADWPAELGRLVPDIAVRLGRSQPPPPVSSPELERLRVFDAVLRLVEWAAAGRPVLLVAEDVHRADPASMQLCAHIGRRLAGQPVLFVLTRRDRPDRPAADALVADLAGRGMEVIDLELGPLSAVELAAVARSVADLSEAAVERVVGVADGNPLLAVESARALAAGSSAPPQNLRAAVRAATRALPRPARDLAEWLAAAGRELCAAELAALPLADGDAAEEAVLDTGLICRSGAGLRFRHALLAEAVRADLGEQGRRYEQLALAIETAAASPERVAAEVAGHLHRAGRDDLAGPRWQRAARHARQLGAMPDAARFWAEAVRCEPEAVAPRLELAEAYGWLGQDADFEREWQAALELLPQEQQSVAWNRRGKVLRTVVCNPRASLAAYQRAFELLPATASQRLRVDILLGAAWTEALAGDPARADSLVDEVAALAADPDDAIVAEMANAELMSLIRRGRFADCEAVAERGGAAARRAGLPFIAYSIWNLTACALSGAGNLTGALRAADTALEATRGITVIEVPCLATRGFVLSRLGRHDEALSAAAEQLTKAERMDSATAAAIARHDAGLISLSAGRYADAAQLLAGALAEAAQIKEISRPAARLACAEALARSGQPDEAAREVRRAALEPVRSADRAWALVPLMARVQGLIAVARGDRIQARRRLTEADAGWRRHLPHNPGADFQANFIDLGRPPIIGLVEPEWELRRLATELAELDHCTEVS
jgi:DNA-binding SARP family transcriptional activator/tetratricopeptide (TPR) repeat protein